MHRPAWRGLGDEQRARQTATRPDDPDGKAIHDFAMIQDGDRVLLGLSGGKDSLALLHILNNLRQRAPVKFELAACTVDPQSPEYDPSPLKPYMAAMGIPYFYESQNIVEQAAAHMRGGSFCAYCSRMRRGNPLPRRPRPRLQRPGPGAAPRRSRRNLHDVVFFGDTLRTMQARYLNDAGDIRIIRPLVYARERQTRDFARNAGLPVIHENCPACFAMPMQRYQMKNLLAEQEKLNNTLFASLLTAMKPIMVGINKRDRLDRKRPSQTFQKLTERQPLRHGHTAAGHNGISR